MFSERVYRWLLVVYPREHRREYGELMAQLFRDRMRRDGGGFGGLLVWMQMIFDLVGAAFKEHKEGADMKKRIWIGAVLVVLLLTGVVGASALLAQSEWDAKVVFAGHDDIKTFSSDGVDGIAEAMQKAVEEGAISQETADEVTRAFNGLPASAPPSMMVSVSHSSEIFPATGADGLADAMRQAVEEGVIDQEAADQIVRAFNEDGPVNKWSPVSFPVTGGLADGMWQAVEEGVIDQDTAGLILQGGDGGAPSKTWRHYSFSETGGFPEALRQAVEEGVISQATADQILRSFGGE